MYDERVRELDDLVLDRQQEDIIEQMKEMGEIDELNTGGRVHLQGGGGGGDLTARRMEAAAQRRSLGREGEFKDTDDMYSWLSTADPTYREEAFRDQQWRDWWANPENKGEGSPHGDVEAWKRAVIESGDPRGIFSGNITDTRYQSPEEIDNSYKYLDHFNRMAGALGMDPSTMSTNVQSNLSGNIAPWATNAQHTALTNANNANNATTAPVNTGGGAPGTYNAATNSYSPAPSGSDWQPFMNLDQAENYYGQWQVPHPYANGGPVALRRKMFTMGGNVDKSHGVGLTSGLTRTVPPQRGPMAQGYKTGGHVLPKGFVPGRVGYQPDWSPAKQGDREGHYGWLASLVAPGLRTALQVGKSLGTKGGLGQWFKYGAEGAKTQAANVKRLSELKAASVAAAKKAAKKRATKKAKEEAAEAAAKVAAKITEVGAKGTKGLGSLRGQIARGLALPGAAAVPGYGAYTSMDEKDPSNRFEQITDALGKGTLDFTAPGLLYMAQDYLRTPADEDYKFRTLSEYLSGDPLFPGGEEAEAIDTTQLEPTQFATAAEQQEKMKQEYLAKIELYKELLGAETQDDNLGTFADTMFAMSGALEEGKGWSGALRSANQALGDEVKSRRTAKQDINTAAVNQAFADITGDDQMLRQANLQALAAGDTGFLQREQVQAEAMQREIPPIDPFLDDGGELDTEELSKKRGQVFVDYTAALAGGFYLAVDMNGNVAAFNSLERAIAHAGTTTT